MYQSFNNTRNNLHNEEEGNGQLPADEKVNTTGNVDTDMENPDTDTGSSTPQLAPKERNVKLRYVGTVRLLSDLERIEVAFLLVAFVSLVTAFVISFVRVSESAQGQPDFTFGILLIINLFFVLLYTVNGVFCEKPFEVLMSVLATFIVMLYCIIEYASVGHKGGGARRNEKLGRLVAISFFGPVDMVLGVIISWKYFASKRLIFRTVGGKVDLQNMCQLMYSFSGFLKFDFELVISLLVLVLNGAGDSELSLLQKISIGIGVPVSLLWVILGFVMIRFEKRVISGIFWGFGLLLPVFIVYEFTRLRSNPNNPFLLPTTIVICSVGILVRITTLILSYFVTRNFNKGLKEKVYNKDGGNDGKRPPRT